MSIRFGLTARPASSQAKEGLLRGLHVTGATLRRSLRTGPDEASRTAESRRPADR